MHVATVRARHVLVVMSVMALVLFFVLQRIQLVRRFILSHLSVDIFFVILDGGELPCGLSLASLHYVVVIMLSVRAVAVRCIAACFFYFYFIVILVAVAVAVLAAVVATMMAGVMVTAAVVILPTLGAITSTVTFSNL
jgi:hypothetical protein